ncbi:hypothetical protein QJS10_CPA05g00344 [Acorus calamus]|uniref:Uncharacterized protein n=1 Tax=Acorus calamus TaxID=4465 RepID=A0AAV9EV99_ACOCL|nr:hypothetical protein QJS10_CPA05g00344 [Acorus calamus]
MACKFLHAPTGECLHMCKVSREGVKAPEELARFARRTQGVKVIEFLNDANIRSMVQQNFDRPPRRPGFATVMPTHFATAN